MQEGISGLRKGHLLGAALVVVTGLVVALSVVFAQSDQVGRVVDQAEVLRSAEELLAVGSSERGALAIGLLVAQAETRGYASEAQLQATLEDVVTGARELAVRGEELDAMLGGAGDIAETSADAREIALETVRLVQTGRLTAAAESATSFIDALERLEGEVVDQRSATYALMMAEEGTAGRLVRGTSVAVGLLLPGAALFAFRFLSQRRQKRAMLQLQLAHEQERVRVKDQMISGLSHQLRTPLTGIYGAALAMEEQGFDDSEFQREMTGLIVNQSADLARMVEDLLVAAKATNGELTVRRHDVDMPAAVSSVVDPFAARGATFRVDCEPAFAEADDAHVRHVLRNLIANAVRHGGPNIAVVGRSTDSTYTVSVVDDGDGIDASLSEALFEPFVHDGDAPLVTGSLGMGLSVGRTLAREMGGDLRYTRVEGRTVFSFELGMAARRVGSPA